MSDERSGETTVLRATFDTVGEEDCGIAVSPCPVPARARAKIEVYKDGVIRMYEGELVGLVVSYRLATEDEERLATAMRGACRGFGIRR